jgi:hypothetical protein
MPWLRRCFSRYRKLADKRLGLPIDCNAVRIEGGITRMVNGFKK